LLARNSRVAEKLVVGASPAVVLRRIKLRLALVSPGGH